MAFQEWKDFDRPALCGDPISVLERTLHGLRAKLDKAAIESFEIVVLEKLPGEGGKEVAI